MRNALSLVIMRTYARDQETSTTAAMNHLGEDRAFTNLGLESIPGNVRWFLVVSADPRSDAIVVTADDDGAPSPFAGQRWFVGSAAGPDLVFSDPNRLKTNGMLLTNAIDLRGTIKRNQEIPLPFKFFRDRYARTLETRGTNR